MSLSTLWDNRRVQLARCWLAGDRGGDVGALELARVVLGPTREMWALPMLRSVRREGDFWVVRTALSPRPLYYPVSAPWRSLALVLAEQASPRGWHRYEVPPVTVAPGDVVLDCGAAEGVFTAMALPRARRVIAVEPVPAFAEGLRRAFAGDAVTVVEGAVAREPGVGSLQGEDIRSRLAPEGGGPPVQVETIDGLVARMGLAVGFVKIHVEGAELEALAGGAETIRRDRPRMAITTDHATEHAAQLESLLRGLVPEYRFRSRGLEGQRRAPVMLHAWCPR